jgi:inner membrane protein
VVDPVTFRAVENITHSLVGATLAELALPADARPIQRRLFFAAGIVAANLPDADLFYTRITPPPLGYLLHHRGHTHTLVGCAILGLCGWLIVSLIPPARRLVGELPRRFWTLIAAALLSHVLLDSWNSYGVHPFWPLDNRWYYGDAIYILEPWLWILLGVPIAANARSTPRRLVIAAGLLALPLALVLFRMIPAGALVALAVIGAVFGWTTRRAAPRVRSSIALGCMALFVASMFGLSHLAHGLSLASLRADNQGEILDVVLNPNPASPLCWSALAIEQNEPAGEYVLRRGALALFRGWLPVGLCRSSASNSDLLGASRSRVEWSLASRQSLHRLRDLSRSDCWIRAWLQFGRAPTLSSDDIVDSRFGDNGPGNFTSMRVLAPPLAKVCPPHLTNWGMPRADMLDGAFEN